MTLMGSLYFFLWAAVLMIPAVILGVKEKPIRYYGFFVTIVFAVFATVYKPITMAYLGLYCLWELVLVKGAVKLQKRQGRNKWTFFALVLLSLAPLVTFKISGLLGGSIFGFIGISYLTFKSLQVIIEVHDELIEEVKTFDFMYFLLFFPCLSSGPIDRSRRFNEDLYNVRPKEDYLNLVGDGLFRMVLGMVYKFVLAAAFYQGMTYLGNPIAGTDWTGSTLAYMYCYGFYLFFDFAGYSLMAIGMGYIFGIVTPDNFKKPFISVDIKDFWDRWHITLSHWFRDFVVSRFRMASIRGKWFKNKLTGASIGFMINMTLMGVWHGLSWCYILYGVYHGILLAVTEVYQKKSKFYKKNKKKKWYKIVSGVITFNLVMFGFLIFSGRLI